MKWSKKMIFSILAFLALVISICIKERKKSLCVQSLNCLFEAVYDFIISAYTGAVLSIINFIRTFIFINKNKINKRIYFFILIFFEGIIVINCVLTWNGLISLLPTIGSIIRTYCLWQSNMRLVRISGITTGIFYGTYYIFYQSWFMVLGDLILLVVGIYAVYKNDDKKSSGSHTNAANDRFPPRFSPGRTLSNALLMSFNLPSNRSTRIL